MSDQKLIVCPLCDGKSFIPKNLKPEADQTTIIRTVEVDGSSRLVGIRVSTELLRFRSKEAIDLIEDDFNKAIQSFKSSKSWPNADTPWISCSEPYFHRKDGKQPFEHK